MASIEKIKLGKKDKRAFFNMSHQVNSTMGVGFAEPTMCLDVVPNTKVDIQAFTGVRLAPLPQPTTGKLKMKQFYSYVKTKDVFEAFDNLQSQTSVASSRGSYIPQECDNISNHYLFLLLMISSAWRFNYAISSGTKLTNHDICGQFFRLSFNVDYKVFGDTPDGQAKIPVHNIFDEWLDVFKTRSSQFETYYLYQAVTNTITENLGVIARALHSSFGYDYVNDWDYESWLNKFLFMQYDSELYSYMNNLPSPLTHAFADYYKFCSKIAPADTFMYSKGTSFDNADFYFSVNSDDMNFYRGDGEHVYQYEGVHPNVYIGIHLTPAGKRLFKIYNTLFGNFRYKQDLELPKLYAFYKAYFDIFNPGRNIQWKDTNCYRLIHSFYDSPAFSVSQAFKYYAKGGASLPDQLDYEYISCVSEFFIDLASCFYTEKVDPITVATESPVLFTSSGSNQLDDFSLFANDSENRQYIEEGYGENNDVLGGLSVRFLQSLYNWVNKNTVIGQRVAQYMAEHFGVNIPRTSFIDKDSFDIDIFDSVATVNNEQTALGEYAGLGKGRANGQSHQFEAPEHGYIFQMSIIVPVGGYVQTSPVSKIRRFDWYQPQFDSVGMEPMGMSEVFDRTSWLNSSQSDNPTFGFRPRYFNMKYKNNLANGGFSFRSERGMFLGYSLDKLFSEPELYRGESNVSFDYSANQGTKLLSYDGVTLRPDEELRYIGKDECFGNYDRIFYDTTGQTDNFIVYIDNNVKMFAPMKPISDCFEAFDETQDTDVVEVSHS